MRAGDLKGQRAPGAHRGDWGSLPAPHLRQALSQERGNIEQIKFLLGHSSIQSTERYLGSKHEIEIPVNDYLGLYLGRTIPISGRETTVTSSKRRETQNTLWTFCLH